MLFQVNTPVGTHVVDAGCNFEAKAKVRNQIGDTRNMQARKIDVDYPEVIYQPLSDDESLQKYEGKDVIIYDEHHGTAVRIWKATAAVIDYYLDEYSAIIVLQKKSPSE